MSEESTDFSESASSEDFSDFGEEEVIAVAPKTKAPPAKPAKKDILAAAKKTKKSSAPSSMSMDENSELSNSSSRAKSSKVAAKTAAKTKSKATADSAKTVEEIYQKKTQLEHILLRPDTYIGSVETQSKDLWIFEDGKMLHRPVNYVPGFYKIFDEIIVNAADNKIRDSKMDTLKVTIDRENNEISVFNNGRGIPVQMHAKENVWVPELIFGHLLTSSNYDDDEKKVTGGRNGYGAKLCNIFSKEFVVETSHKESGNRYKQVFKNNMSERGKPSITKANKDDFTKITFKPDLEKFGMECIDNDLEAVIKKRVHDMAGILTGVKVYLNDERLKVKNFKDYVNLFLEHHTLESGSKPPVMYERISDRWEVAFTVSDGQFQQASFVNSISTVDGGTHVKHVADQLVEKIAEAVKKKNKGTAVKPNQIRDHMWLFINCMIENPSFSSQTKENMTLKVSKFGSKCSLSEDFIKKSLKSGIVDNVLAFARARQNAQLKKTDGAKRSRINGVAKLDDANNAGTKNAKGCTLILTEGDSAKALAVSGLSIVGRDNFGVFPLRGKMLNVREASHTQILNNHEIQSLKKIIGLAQGKKYTSVQDLRYGHVMIMADQDGMALAHIRGRKCTKGPREVSFFTLPEYEEWKRLNSLGKGWHIKYYKGLGTSTAQDAKKYFNDLDRHMKPFKECIPEDRQLIDMAFSKKRSDDRKEWLRSFQPGTFMDHDQEEISVSDFVNKELILFSLADNVRSIPSVVDGLKPGQRKILFGCFKRKLHKELKVAQLAGYVSEQSAYHHGEQSLCSTIVNLAQTYVGSNNVNLLEPIGQFGTRLQGGKDHASARYIYTHLSPVTRLVFHQHDDALLKYLNDDGQNIEPEWYMPVVPMVLVNGAEGIGTGWSTSVPTYNPRDIVANLLRKMDGGEYEKMIPWYRGFTGEIEAVADDKYKLSGRITKLDSTTIEITELPVGMWTQSYKEYLEILLSGNEKTPAFIKDYKEYHTDTSVHFVVTLAEDNLTASEKEGFDKKFKFTSQKGTTNMVLFDREGRLKKYSSVEEIMNDFFDIRVEYYTFRKNFLMDLLTKEWERLDNRLRFITEIIETKLRVQNRKKMDVIEEMIKRGYKSFPKNSKDTGDAAEEEQDDAVSASDFDYLLGMPIYSLTMEKAQQLRADRDEKQAELDQLLSKTPKDLWKDDLNAFSEEWINILKSDKENSKVKTTKGRRASLNMKKGGKKARKVVLSRMNESDESDSDEDEDDDFVRKVVKSSAPVKREPVKRAPAVKPKTKLKKDDDVDMDAGDLKQSSASVNTTSNKGGSKQTSLLSMFSKVPSVKASTLNSISGSTEVSGQSNVGGIISVLEREVGRSILDDSDDEVLTFTQKLERITAENKRTVGQNAMMSPAKKPKFGDEGFRVGGLATTNIDEDEDNYDLHRDEDDEDDFEVKKKTTKKTAAAPAKKPVGVRKKKTAVIAIESDEESDQVSVKAKPKPVKKTKAAATVKATPQTKKAAPMIIDSESSMDERNDGDVNSDSDSAASASAIGGLVRGAAAAKSGGRAAATKKVNYKVNYGTDGEEEVEEEEDDFGVEEEESFVLSD